jgi:hypothetical protein
MKSKRVVSRLLAVWLAIKNAAARLWIGRR